MRVVIGEQFVGDRISIIWHWLKELVLVVWTGPKETIPLLCYWITKLLNTDTLDLTNSYFLGQSAWEWLKLLIGPGVATIIGVGLNQYFKIRDDDRRVQENKNEENRLQQQKKIEEDQLRQSALVGYFDQMTQLLISSDWHKRNKQTIDSFTEQPIIALAKARTFALLNELDGKRKGSLILFLYEAKLLNYISLKKANLRESILNDANLSDANLSEANLSNAQLNFANLHSAKLSESNCQDVKLNGANLRSADLHKADLSHSDLSGALLDDATLKRAKMYWAKLHRTDLLRANLAWAKLRWAELNEAKLIGADLTWANLTEAELPSTNLHKAILKNANLSHTNLRSTNLYMANLTKANLSEAKLLLANLDNANLVGANLYGADLRCASLVQSTVDKMTNFRNAVLRMTTWGDSTRAYLADRGCLSFRNGHLWE